MTVKIKLGRSDRYMTIDAEDEKLVRSFRLHCGTRYVRVRTSRTLSVALHRILIGAKPGEIVDHIDRDRLNNTKANLRITTQAKNCRNGTKRRDNTEGFIGVRQRESGKWRAEIMLDQKHYFSRVVGTKIEAALEYDKLAQVLHGEFAKQNFPTVKVAA